MKDHIKKGLNTEKASSSGPMEPNMRENSRIIILMAQVSTNGLMVDSMKEVGHKIKCMEKVSLFGLMEESLQEIMSLIKNKASVSLNGIFLSSFLFENKQFFCFSKKISILIFSIGLMVENTLVSGRMVYNME